MLATNKKGETLELTILEGETAAAGKIECLLALYGTQDNYANDGDFDEARMRQQIRDKALGILTAVTKDGVPVATVSAKKRKHFPHAAEIGSLAVHPDYNGYQLGQLIAERIMEKCEKAYPLLYCHIAMFHDVVSKFCEAMDYVPTGFLMDFCDTKNHMKQLSFPYQKHSTGVYVRNLGETTRPTLYVPESVGGLAREIYTAVNAQPEIRTGAATPTGDTAYEFEQDDENKTLYVYLWKCGADLRNRRGGMEAEYAHALQTFIVFLNINDPGAVYGFEALRAQGFAFAGFKPLCGQNDFAIFSKTRAQTDYAALKMTDRQKKLAERLGFL